MSLAALPKRHKVSTRRVLTLLGFNLVTLALLGATFWFGFFAANAEAPLHNQSGIAAEMIMGGKVTILDEAGQPAALASVILENEQVQTDQQGVAYFEHLMLHDHRLQVNYQGEHYTPRLHVHSADSTVTLGWSLETYHRVSLIFGGLLCVWLTLFLVFSLRRSQRLTKTKATRLSWAGRALPVGLLLSGLMLNSFLLISPNAAGWQAKAAGTVLASLPVPTGLAAEQDDNNAILTWNGGPLNPAQNEPAGISGYKVSWGLPGQLNNVQLTHYRILQLQPLVNGQTYQAVVQSVDNFGNVSAASAPFSFTGSSARVDALRSRMTAFFDDFNRPAGAVDELKWNVAYSNCNNPQNNAFFINTQFHAHNLINASNCDRGQNVSRPRQTFDFTGRTGTIAFDFDGELRRDQWYLDLVPNLIDITGQVNINSGQAANPGNMLRFHQNGQLVVIEYVDATGVETVLAQNMFSPTPTLDWLGLNTIPNVRRHWEIKVSQTSAEVFINGVSIAKTALNLPFSKATVLWNEFSYNTPKSNEPFVLVHWDNFGFDGPAPTIETHNYRTPISNGSDFVEAQNTPIQRQITIPDQLTGEKAERLMFTLQMSHLWYSYSPSDQVVVNGKTFPMPQPTGPVTAPSALVGAYNPYTEVINLPLGTLKTGVNTLEFTCKTCGVNNIHTEVDFPLGSAPAYTPPEKIYGLSSVPTLPDVGPAAYFVSLGSTNVAFHGPVTGDTAKQVYPLSGQVGLHVLAHNDIALAATGKNPGIARVELWLDKKPIWTQDTGGTPYFETTYNLDTTQFGNGPHELFFVAYSPAGTPSIPDYFEGTTASGDYYPVLVNISNAQSGPTATATKAATATSTPVPATATATPVPPTATATSAPPTATATKSATATSVPATATKAPPTATSTSGTGGTAPTATATKSATPTTVRPPNLLVNPGFEKGLEGWYCSSGVKAITTGMQAGKGAASFPSGTWDDCHQDFKLEAGKKYEIIAYVQASTDQVPFVGVGDYSTGTWYKYTACRKSNTYVRCSLTFTAPRTATFGIFAQAQQGAFRLDNMYFAALP